MGEDQTFDNSDTPEAEEILAIEKTDYFKIGLSLTAVILLLASTYAFVEFDALYQMKPNEFGDFLAGIFGPLVLLWVVMGFLQQGAELKYSREALLLQAKELKASVEAQQNMGEAAWASVTMERESKIALETQQIKARQPLLTLHRGNSEIHNGRSRRDYFRISNLGQTCVSLRLDLSDKSLKVTPMANARLENGQEFAFGVENLSSAEAVGFLLTAKFRNLDGEDISRSYDVAAAGETLVVLNEFGDAAPHPLDPTPIPR